MIELWLFTYICMRSCWISQKSVIQDANARSHINNDLFLIINTHKRVYGLKCV